MDREPPPIHLDEQLVKPFYLRPWFIAADLAFLALAAILVVVLSG